jgi:hypothetical protein
MSCPHSTHLPTSPRGLTWRDVVGEQEDDGNLELQLEFSGGKQKSRRRESFDFDFTTPPSVGFLVLERRKTAAGVPAQVISRVVAIDSKKPQDHEAGREEEQQHEEDA